VTLQGSTVSGNGDSGLYVWREAQVRLEESLIEGNGTNEWCSTDQICTGLLVDD
jgi:hypothetical protein